MQAQIITTKDLFDGLQALLGKDSAYAVAKHLGATPGSGLNWKKGKTMDDMFAIKAALSLGLDPDYVLACLQAERVEKSANSEAAVEHWKNIALKIKRAA